MITARVGLLTAWAVLSGCSEPASKFVDRQGACLEQASAWCGLNPGCRTIYLGECLPDGAPDVILLSEQEACIAALTTPPHLTVYPIECEVTWP